MTRSQVYDLRCGCSSHPILAKYGRDRSGLLFVHLKVYKQGRVYGEAVFTEGTVTIRCRSCNRWNRVVIRQPGGVSMHPGELPPSIDASMLADNRRV